MIKRFVFHALIVVIFLSAVLLIPMVDADSHTLYPTPISLPEHRQIPLFLGPYNTSQTNIGNPVPVPTPASVLISTPISTPLCKDDPTKFHIDFQIPQFLPFSSFKKQQFPYSGNFLDIDYNNRVCGKGCLINSSPYFNLINYKSGLLVDDE